MGQAEKRGGEEEKNSKRERRKGAFSSLSNNTPPSFSPPTPNPINTCQARYQPTITWFSFIQVPLSVRDTWHCLCDQQEERVMIGLWGLQGFHFSICMGVFTWDAYIYGWPLLYLHPLNIDTSFLWTVFFVPSLLNTDPGWYYQWKMTPCFKKAGAQKDWSLFKGNSKSRTLMATHKLSLNHFTKIQSNPATQTST